MRRIGFLISEKENENRRALLPIDLEGVGNRRYLYFQEGYGKALGISDEDYKELGCHVATKEQIMNLEIICDPKIGDANYLDRLKKNQIIFGWVHATQNEELTQLLIDKEITAYAWENMVELGRHVFWKNNEIAGEAAVLHAYQCHGKMPSETSVGVLGKGNIARGAIRTLTQLGAKVKVYDRKMEQLFREEVGEHDVLVNAILWDLNRKDHIIYKDDLKKMKPGAMIIDISCDEGKGIETSIPTSIEDPTYYVEGIMHYVVDHTPSLYYKTVSESLSTEISKYIDDLVEGASNKVLEDCLILVNGKVVDEIINEFQGR